MKLIMKYSFSLLALATIVFASCENDDNYEPIIGTGAEIEFASKIPSVDNNSVSLLWYPNERAISYTVEYSTDETFPVDPEKTWHATTIDNRITISDLEYLTVYYVRIRANYMDGAMSDWTDYLEFETTERTIPTVLIIQPTDVVGITVILRWNVEKYTPTHVSFEKYNAALDEWTLWLDGSTPATLEDALIEITDQEKLDGAKFVGGFPEKTTMRATIYDMSLGLEEGTYNSVEFTTALDLPEGTITVPNGSSLSAAIESAEDGATIFLPAGWNGTWAATTMTKSVTIMSDPDSRAVLSFENTARNIKATDATFTFKNLIFNVTSATSPNYILTLANDDGQGAQYTGLSFIFENCRFTNPNVVLRVIKAQGANPTGNIKLFKLNNCYLVWDDATQASSVGDGLIRFPSNSTDGTAYAYLQTDPVTLESYVVTNTTFVNAKRRFIAQFAGSSANRGVNLRDIVYTIQNSSFIGSDNLDEGNWFRFSHRNGSGGRTDRGTEAPYQINYFNCLFAKLPAYADAATFNPMGLAQVRFQGRVFRTADQLQTATNGKSGFEGSGLSGDSEAMIALDQTSEDIFVNIAGQDFHFKPDAIYEEQPIGQLGIGDPRWYDDGVTAPAAPASPGNYPAYDTDMI